MKPLFLAVTLLILPQLAPSQEKITEKVSGMIAGIRVKNLVKTVDDLVGFGTRHILSGTDDPKRGTGAARTYLEARLKSLIELSGGRLKVAREVSEVNSSRLRGKVKAVNIVATLEGVSDPKRVYVVGGHYDSINGNSRDSEGAAPGANDDGSGIAVVLEACRVMCPHTFAATIVFVCYDGEEHGLLGSSAHAQALKDAEMDVDGMITDDIVGNTLGMDGVRRDSYLRCFSYSPTGSDSTGRNMARAATYATRRHVKDFELKMVCRGDRYGRGGDHKPFFRLGYPAIRFSESCEDYSRQHQNISERNGKPYGDLPAFVDFAYVAKVAAVNVALLSELASAPRAPRSARVRGARNAYDISVSWEPAGDAGDAAAYEFVWRETTASDWQGSRLVEDARRRRGGLSAVLAGVLLDDVVVGVRAVGKDGSRSRAVTPPEPDASSQRRRSRRNR